MCPCKTVTWNQQNAATGAWWFQETMNDQIDKRCTEPPSD